MIFGDSVSTNRSKMQYLHIALKHEMVIYRSCLIDVRFACLGVWMTNQFAEEHSVRVLIVDDQEADRLTNQEVVERLFRETKNYDLQVKHASSVKEMYALIQTEQFHLILLDKCLGFAGEVPIDGVEHIPAIKSYQPITSILVVTSLNETAIAVRAMQLGASGFIPKPMGADQRAFRDIQILNSIQDAIQKMEFELLKARAKRINEPLPMFKSAAMQSLDKRLQALAEYPTPVLLLGESGLGKGYTAERLNQLTKKFLNQKERVLLNINSTTIQGNLAESELFGFEKGSFTGAQDRKLGIFELANDGDLFLDEIGDASLELQAKLLKIIEEKQFKRIGGSQMLRTNARLIFATNRNLKEMVARGEFRHDLYARISTFSLELPSLEDRKEDIPFICEQLISRICEQTGAQFSYQDFPVSLQQHFHRDNIPGNIRGIQSEILQLLVLSDKNAGKPDFRRWRDVISISPIVRKSKKDVIDRAALRERETNFLTPDFPGLKTLTSELEDRVFAEARIKHPEASNREIAKILGIAESTFYGKFERRHVDRGVGG